MKIYDGKDAILGRLATKVAKDALLGEEVKVINCESVVISGQKYKTFASQKQKYDRRGYPLKSTKLTRLPERFVRHTIRGMLPWKLTRGREAFSRIMCYKGIPESLQNETFITVDTSSKLPNSKHITVGEICKNLGGK